MEALYLVSYDLNKPEKNYPKLINYLESIGSHRVLYSEWFVRSNANRDSLYNAVKAHVDSNDGLMVCTIQDAIGTNMKYDLRAV